MISRFPSFHDTVSGVHTLVTLAVSTVLARE